MRLPRHEDKPFRVVGILERSGTPVDRTGHVGLEAIEVNHIDWQQARYGIFIALGGLTTHELMLLGMVMLAGLLVGLMPGYRAYRLSLADGLSIRI